MRFVSFVAKETNSTIPFDEEAKSNRGINTMRRVVKSKIQKLKPVVEYNKRGRPHGKAAVEMHRTLGCYHMVRLLACTRVPLVNLKWTELPNDTKEQIWEAIEV